jgi:hypothetical protein
MALMIVETKFDVLWPQYYNTPQCSARKWIDNNPNYESTHQENPSGFKDNYDAFVNSLAGTASADAKLYLGLMGSPSASTLSPTDYLDPDFEVKPLVEAHFCNKNFGGIMIWEAFYANSETENQRTFYEEVKSVLLGISQDPSLPCVHVSSSISTASSTVSTTASPTLVISVISLPVAASSAVPKVSVIASAGGAACGTAGCAKPSSSALVPFQGAASTVRLGAGGMVMSVALAVLGMMAL